jgi:hypothetical protein
LKADQNPGLVVLFGSGETSPSGRKIFDHILRQTPPSPQVALLETPAGFELNSAQVIGRVADFLEHHLQNYHPQTFVVPARRRGTACSPDLPEIARPLLTADLIFMGPGSPTYAVRQLRDSLAWHYLVARHRLGAALVLASAAVVAVSSHVLPVYEIYKAGEELHWKPGLDLFAPYGLPLVFIPHWNNTDGGGELDTNRCFMGRNRFNELFALLPAGQTVVGIDEKTALILDLQAGAGLVMGQGGITVLKTPSTAPSALSGEPVQAAKTYPNGQQFSLAEWGSLQTPAPGAGLPAHAWHTAVQAVDCPNTEKEPPENVLALVAAREAFRQQKDWRSADRLRDEILELGWNVSDGPCGPSLQPAERNPGQ